MKNLKWWQKAVFYQIYPRSFADGNGDGIGDFKGMIDKLDYLQELGIDAVWLSPHFPSPFIDCGYDIADYENVAPEYGTLEDFRRFLDMAHGRKIRVILDLVLNHTSDQHAWFKASRSSRDNPYRDWYIWRDPKPGGGPPNNWLSTFDGIAWEYDQPTGQYYYHYFFKEQPDLNWRNPDVKKAMFDAARFWLDMGVDGFRLDAIGTIYEDPAFPDQPADITYRELRRIQREARTGQEKKEAGLLWDSIFRYQLEQPGLHELMRELRAVMDEYGPGERMLVGENDNIAYQGSGSDELHMVFNFPLMQTKRITPAHVLDNQKKRLAALAAVSADAWQCNTLSNHDTPRMYNQFGDGVHDDQLARLHFALLLTLKGTPFFFNGDEIGMSNVRLTDISQFHDTMAIWLYRSEVDEFGVDPAEALKNAAAFTRDQGRSPMQWNGSVNAGFCPKGVQPWLPVNPDYTDGVNVADQVADSGSLLHFVRRFLLLRRNTPALVEGSFLPLDAGNEDCLTFLRCSERQTCLVALNFSDKPYTLDFSNTASLKDYSSAQILHPKRKSLTDMRFDLPPWGILVTEVR